MPSAMTAFRWPSWVAGGSVATTVTGEVVVVGAAASEPFPPHAASARATGISASHFMAPC